MAAIGSRPARTRRLCWALLAALGAGGCGDAGIVVLGDRDAPRWHFGEPRRLDELAAPAKTDNPSLTADMLELYFTSERNLGPAEIFVAERAQRDEPFGAPRLVRELSSPVIETTPAVSADGLVLWFASDREGGLGDLDVWVATRAARGDAWSAPENLAALNSANKDIPRPLGQRGQVMPMASERDSPGYYRIFFAERAGRAASFEPPEEVPELVFPRESTVDGFLTDDGLTLFYVTGPAIGPADLYVASRRSTDDPFEQHAALDALNSERDERDPWLSPDGRELFFASDRSGQYAIYVVDATRQPASAAP